MRFHKALIHLARSSASLPPQKCLRVPPSSLYHLTYIMHMPALYFQKTDPESCDACLGSGEKECDWCHGTGEERTNEGAECNNAMLICAEIPFWSSYK